MAIMTGREFIATIIMSIFAVALLVYFWPRPPVEVDTGGLGQEILDKFKRENLPRSKPSPRKVEGPGAELLENMQKAADKIADRFEPTLEAALKAAEEGNLNSPEPFDGELNLDTRKIEIHLVLLSDGKPTFDRDKGVTTVLIRNVEGPSLDSMDGSGPDYRLLGSVLANLREAQQARSDKRLVVEIVPMAFVSFESVREVIYAAARAGIRDIRLEQSPIPD